MIIKKGDKVIVISGADKGKTGVVQKALPKLDKVVVEGVNVRKKHRKPTQANPEGSIVDIYAPIHVSNVALIDPKTKKATRVGFQVENGKKVRVSVGKKASGSKLD
ncbi:MAG: 50S ribosomal protein L24 [Bacilli bacterium]|nr:50S ribosomal protein L24 [Bacilli bacterium]